MATKRAPARDPLAGILASALEQAEDATTRQWLRAMLTWGDFTEAEERGSGPRSQRPRRRKTRASPGQDYGR
jgi:hypothetical protein